MRAAAALACASAALAQGGGASSTGTIQGRVADAQGAVLPGVTVTATSPALIQPQTTVTSETGNYRFPAVPPGTYSVSFELAGFTTLKRDGIAITLGFTAQVNADLALATLQETVTVSGVSPIIDTSATRVQQNFKMEQLQSLPNGRDMWALLAVTPSVMMGRMDVAGNRAGTQTAYSRVRPDRTGAGADRGHQHDRGHRRRRILFRLRVARRGVPRHHAASRRKCRTPACRASSSRAPAAIASRVSITSIGTTTRCRRRTSPTNTRCRRHSTTARSARTATRWIATTITTSTSAGRSSRTGPGCSSPTASSSAPWRNRTSSSTRRSTRSCGIRSSRRPIRLNQKNKLIGYYQWGQKEQLNRLPFATYTYASPEQTFKQDSGSWVYKGEWNGTVSDKLYLEARYGDFGYYFPLYTNSPDNFFWHDTGRLVSEGAHQKQQLDRDRQQYTGAATYFVDSAAGSHTFKMGAELLREKSWEGFESRRGGTSNIEQIYNNGVSTQVIFGIPTASCKVGSLEAHACLESKAALDQVGAFVTDTWTLGRTTLNLGVRYDRYHAWLPEQRQLAATVGPVTVPAKQFAEDRTSIPGTRSRRASAWSTTSPATAGRC